MARLPIPGQDEGTWGDVLNDYLQVSLSSTGAIKANALPPNAVQDATITEAKLDSALQTKVNSAAGDPTMGGALTGTASNAQLGAGVVTTAKLADASVTTGKLADDAVTNVKLASGIAQAKITNLTTDLAGKASASHTHAAADVASGTLAIGRLPTGTSSTTVALGDHSHTLNGLSDVDTAGVSNGDTLKYNGTSWVPGADNSGGSGATDLATTTSASDVTVTSSTGADATIAAATTSVAGVMTAADKVALAAKASSATTVTGATSLTGGGDLTANRTISLVNDAATPGNSYYYGTNGSGAKGYYAIPTQNPTVGGDLSGTASNAQIVAGAVGNSELASDAVTEPKLAVTNSPSNNDVLSWNGSALSWAAVSGGSGGETNTASNVGAGGVSVYKQKAGVNLEFKSINAGSNKISVTNDTANNEVDIDVVTANLGLTKSDVGLANVDNTSDASKPISTATQTALDAKLAKKNGQVDLTDSTNDKLARVDITDDASSTAGWPDRLAFYFSGVRTGYHNEYGELRARPAKVNTIALRALQWSGASTVDIFQVTNSAQSAMYLGVGPTAMTVAVAINSTANISTTGTVSGSNIGAKVTASSTAPSSPATGDVWIDLSA